MRWSGWWAASAPLIAFLALPVFALVISAKPEEVLAGLSSPSSRSALTLSAWTSVASTLTILVLGTPLAYALSKRPKGLGRLVEALVDLPLLLPPAVAGVALLLAFGRAGLLGPALSVWGVELPFTTIAVVAAQVFVACPLYVRAAALGLAGVSGDLSEAAVMDGSNTWNTFRRIQMPLAAAALVEGAIISWARALGEFGATLIFAGNFPGRTQTMPLAIYLGFEFDFRSALALSALLLAVSVIVLLVARCLRPTLSFRAY